MDSLTVYHLARELDARWREGTIRTGHLDRDAKRVIISTGHGRAAEIDLSRPDVVVRERADADERGPLAGWIIESVRAPEDDRRLVIALAREGKFRGSVSKRALLAVSMLPTARSALAHESGRVIARIGGSLPPASAPRPVLDDETVRRAASRGDVATLMTGRWVSPLIAKWLVRSPELAVVRYGEICALGPAHPSWCGASLVPLPFCDDAVPASSLIAPAASANTADDSAGADGRRDRALERMRRELARAGDAPRLRLLALSLIHI